MTGALALGLCGPMETAAGAGTDDSMAGAEPESSDRAVTLEPPPRTWEDRPTTLSGVLIGGSTADQVQLRVRIGGADRWAPLGDPLPVSADGGFATEATFRDPGPIALAATDGQVESAIVELRVRDRRVRAGKMRSAYAVLAARPRFRGWVVPSEPGQRIEIWTRRPKEQPRRAAVVRTGAAGRFSYRLPARSRRETRAVWAVSRGGAPSAREHSARKRYRLVPRLAAEVSRVARKAVRESYHRGCPVGPSRLRRITMVYRGFDNTYHWGRLVVAVRYVEAMKRAFRRGLASGLRIRRMVPVEAYGGSDPRSMAADNTSAFNCRQVTGDPYSLSPHSYGYAVDINPVENPYQDSAGRWWPRAGLRHRDRSRKVTGMIRRNTVIRRAFGALGFRWGGFWTHRDWQHFDAQGRR